MLLIRSEQMKVFEEAAWLRFEDEMVVHSQEFSPKLCRVIGEEQLRLANRQAIERAVGYEFDFRGPIRLFIELTFLFGSHFDTDPQYPQYARILNATGDQMGRAEQLHAEVVNYLQKVSDVENVNASRALENLWSFAHKPLPFSADDFSIGMRREMTIAYPQKAAYVGDEALASLISEGEQNALKYGFDTVRGATLMVTLMYAFGHGCCEDPLYPWISRTLSDEKIVDAKARAGRLEKKALTWLEHVLDKPDGEGAGE